MKFDVVLFTDSAEFATKTRGYGVHRLASHIRLHGYSCIVIDFSSAIDYSMYREILELTVGDNTLMVGYSTTWLPFKFPGMPATTTDIGREFRRTTDADRFDITDDSPFAGTLPTAFGNGHADEWLKYSKELNPKAKIVLGGTMFSMYLDVKTADYFVKGLAETMTIDLLNSLSGKGPKRIFNKIIDYDQKAQTPVWDFRDSKTTYTDYDFITEQETLSLEIGRGCRFKCKYCSYPLIGQKNINDYLKHEEVIRAELLENYNRWRVTNYFFLDDTLNDSTEKLQMLLNVTRSLPFKINFWCYLRLDLLATHPEQIPMLKEIGLAWTYFGIETFNEKAGRAVGKGLSAERKKKALIMCKEIWGDSVHIQSGFIVGLPHENIDSIAQTAEYLKDPSCPIDQAWIFPLNIAGPHPTTEHMYKSEFDREYDKWGYYFDDPEKPWHWSKNDDTGIYNHEQASLVASQFDRTVPKKVYKGDLYRSTLAHYILSDRKKTLSMTQQEYDDLIKSIDLPAVYYGTVMNQYFIPLLKKLREDIS